MELGLAQRAGAPLSQALQAELQDAVLPLHLLPQQALALQQFFVSEEFALEFRHVDFQVLQPATLSPRQCAGLRLLAFESQDIRILFHGNYAFFHSIRPEM